MTRTERVVEQVRKAKEKLEAQRKALAQAEAAQREVARKDVNKRRYLVGALAHEAGLFRWSNPELAALFQVLARLEHVHNPGAVLEGLLGGDDGRKGAEGHGGLSNDSPPLKQAAQIGLSRRDTPPQEGCLHVSDVSGAPAF